MKITLKDLAEVCNVSISTVSKSLNDSKDISEATKNRIRAIAAVHGYQPNILALNLKNGSSKTIGVILPNILNYFFVHVLQGIEEASREQGFKVVTCISNDEYRLELESMSTLANGSVDGLLLSLAKETQTIGNYEHINNVIRTKIPVVLFDRVSETVNCDKVISDNFDGAFNAVQELITKKCKRIALFITNASLNVIQERKAGYISALTNSNLFNDHLILNIESISGSEKPIKEFLSQNEVDGIFSVDELLTVKTIKAARQLDINIPDKLKIIGFGDGELSKEFHPSLSVVNLHAKDIGKTAVIDLIERIKSKNHNKFKSTIVKSSLIHRDSTS